MTTITDVIALGYDCGIARGDTQTEQDALAQAVADSAPEVVLQKAAQVTQDTVAAIDADGKLPTDPDARQALAASIAASAIDMLTQRADERVDFHTRAVAIAETMSNTWHVAGWGNMLYVDCKADGTGWDDQNQELLDALADPGSHAERVWQFDNPDPMAACVQLRSYGYDVERPELGADAFAVDGAAPIDGAALITFASTATPKPTMTESIGEAIAADPGISAATKKLITAALRG